jgi:dihydrofolate synthase/folylpolyglutamate synthase
MIAAVLQAAGYRTGLYTSPHLEHVEERIVVDGQCCPTPQFLALAEQVRPAVERLDDEAAARGALGPTFFEVTTAMAFLHFAQAQVDLAVLEVGLGGRLDSTNVCLPEVCVITSISFDHVKQLGNTLAAIAGEKAGIIKPGVPVISGVCEDEPRRVIGEQAEAVGAPLVQRGVAYDAALTDNSGPLIASGAALGESFTYYEPATAPTYLLRDLHLNMLGHHQAANAAAAVAALRCLRRRGWAIEEQHIRAGLAAARCPARIEQVRTQPSVILDVAHNPASIAAVIATLRERFRPKRGIGLFASSRDKDYTAMLQRVLPAFDMLILTQYVNNPRALETEALLALAQSMRFETSGSGPLKPVLHACVRPSDAWKVAQAIADPEDLICITGSFFLAAELRPLLIA